METITTKKCPRCGYDKPLSAFNISRKAKDGLQSYCRACQKDMAHDRIKFKGAAPKTLEAGLKVALGKTATPSSDNPLSSFTPRELMQELRRRGFEGEIRYTNRIDLSKI